jgi:hypothetical protein
LLYGVVVRTEPEVTEYPYLSYEDVLRIFVDRLLSDEQVPMTIRRRCCSSLNEQTMSVKICGQIRELAGVTNGPRKDGEEEMLRAKLDIAVNNWYIKGEISLSEEGLVKPFDSCGTDRSV